MAKVKLNPEKCQELMWDKQAFQNRQCRRKIWKDGYCHSHHPEKVEERQQKSDVEHYRKMEASPRALLQVSRVKVDRLEAEVKVLKAEIERLKSEVEWG